jgi:hypothetical protein
LHNQLHLFPQRWAALALSVSLASVAHAGEAARNDAIKASYLYKFTPFVGWPSQAFAGPLSPFNLCVTGSERFGAVVDKAVRGRRVGDHPIAVIRLQAVAKGSSCHLLFVSYSRTQSPQEMLEAVAGQSVLTVADQGLFARAAMIQFVTVSGRTRFEIRPQSAESGGLVLSSKLLALSAQRGGDR